MELRQRRTQQQSGFTVEKASPVVETLRKLDIKCVLAGTLLQRSLPACTRATV